MPNASLRTSALNELRFERALQRGLSTAGVIVVIPFSCALLGAYTSEMEKNFGRLLTAGLWILAVVIFAILAARLNPFGKSLLALAVDNEALEETVANYELREQANNRSLNILAFQSNYANGARSIVLNHALLPIDNLDKLKKAIVDLVTPLSYSKEFLFGMGADENWSFSVYLYSKNNDILKCVWREKSKSHPSPSELGRDWQRGEGHIGKAFVDQRSIITGDASVPEASQFSTLPQSKARSHDKVYVSFSAIPIGPTIDVDSRPYGVLTGTSDRKGRFNADNSGILVQISGAIASLLIAGRLNVDDFLPTKGAGDGG